MEKIILGKTGLKVTKVGFGALTIGPWQLNLSVEDGSKVLRYALEKGINFIDTAQYYKTYPYIKKALEDLPNADSVVIASKSLDHSYEAMDFAIQEALLEMGRKTIDIFMLHELHDFNDWKNRQGAWQCLQDAKSKGLVKAIGFSTHHVDMAELAATIPELDLLFPLINMTGIGIRHGENAGKSEDMAAAILKASNAGKGVFAMKVFGGGNLTGRYQEAFHYVYHLPGVESLMIGFGYQREIDDIFQMEANAMPPDYNPPLFHKKVRIDQGDCQRCYACVDRCPNKAMRIDANGDVAIDHELCLTCGYCAPMCNYLAILLF